MERAIAVSSWSKDPSTKVGAVIVCPNRKIIASGYNGPPRAIEDPEFTPENKELKYALTIHAEMNALLAATVDVSEHVMYVTWPPCVRCGVHIIQSGIGAVIYRPFNDDEKSNKWEESCAQSRLLFNMANVPLLPLINNNETILKDQHVR